MIPVFGLPILNRYDLSKKMEESIDVEMGRYYIVDNGGGYEEEAHTWFPNRHVCNPGVNLGWGAAINLIIRANMKADWWFFANADVVFGPGDLDRLEKAMWQAVGPTQVSICGYSAFAVNDKAIELAGWFDENYIPCYCEDSDWHWRAKTLGVTFIILESQTVQLEGGSVTIRERGTNNPYSYPLNVQYHREKWGGPPWEEKYTTPWDRGGDLSVTTAPKLSRLRDQAW